MNRVIRSWIVGMMGEDLFQAITCRIRLWIRFHSLSQSVYNKLYKRQPVTVLSGPFKGINYTRDLVWGIISNKWLGTYEAELHPVVEEIIASHYKAIIDVGCAEGWYAIGLAKRCKTVKVYVYDRDPISIRQCMHLAKINKVDDRIIPGSEFEPQQPPVKDTENTLLICDIEGAEVHILKPDQFPALQKMDILVEVHESSANTQHYADLLRDRFSHTHQVYSIQPYHDREQKLAQGHEPLVELLGESLFKQAVNEHRSPGNHWLWMKKLLD